MLFLIAPNQLPKSQFSNRASGSAFRPAIGETRQQVRLCQASILQNHRVFRWVQDEKSLVPMASPTGFEPVCPREMFDRVLKMLGFVGAAAVVFQLDRYVVDVEPRQHCRHVGEYLIRVGLLVDYRVG
jgi:hypothetical protein